MTLKTELLQCLAEIEGPHDSKATLEKLIMDATRAGLNVSTDSRGTMIRTGKTNRSTGIIIWMNGDITRSDVSLDLCGNISAAQARKVLKIYEVES